MKEAKSVIFLGADHAGYRLKEIIRIFLSNLGYKIKDLGTFSEKPCDYPDFIIPAVRAAVQHKGIAIVFGGTGIGECIAANKVRGARAALVFDAFTARATREHNNANVLCLGSRTVTGDAKLAKRLIKIWLETPFSAEKRHVRRLNKIKSYERTGELPKQPKRKL